MAVYPNKYNKKTDWQEGEYVTAADMNKIEQGIYDSEVYTDEAIAALVSAKQGTSAPTTSTVGTIGQKYLNTTTKDLYECIGISGNSYTWKQIYKWVAADSKYYLVDADGDPIDVSALEAEIAEAATDISELIAPAYVDTKPYNKGDLVTYEGKLYEGIKDDIPVGTLPTNTTYFKEVSVDDVIKEIEDGTREVATAKQAEAIKSDRVIEDADVSCPPITFGTTGGDAEIQTGYNKFQYLYGKSKKFNQIASGRNTASEVYGITRTAVGSTGLKYSGTSTSSTNFTAIVRPSSNPYEWKSGHKYYATLGKVSLPAGAHISASNTDKATDALFDAPPAGSGISGFGVFITSGTTVDFTVYPQLFDLTEIYGAGKEPTTTAEFKKDYPLDYYDYNEGTILSAKSSELVSVGENQWDGSNITTGKQIDGTTGLPTSKSDRSCSDYVRILPNTTYYMVMEGNVFSSCGFAFYDASQNYISGGTNTLKGSFDTPANAMYLRFSWVASVNSTDTISLYIEWDTPGRPYVAHREDRVTLPNIELRSAGKGTNEIRDIAYQAGGGKRYVGVVDMGTLTWYYTPAYERFYATDIPNANCDRTKLNWICSKYEASSVGYSDGDRTFGIITLNGSYAFVRDNKYTDAATFKTAMPGVYLLYELATPTDISTSENPGWTELVYTDNYGTLQFLTDPAQIPQVEQPYYIEYTVSLTDFLDSVYAHADGDAENLALKESVDDIVNGNTPAGKALLADNLESDNKIEDLTAYIMRQSPSGVAKSMELDHLTGATVAWNQLGNPRANTEAGLTVAFDSSKGLFTVTGTGTGNGPYIFRRSSQDPATMTLLSVPNHKYLIVTDGPIDKLADICLRCQVFTPSTGNYSEWNFNAINNASAESYVNVWIFANTGVSVNVKFHCYIVDLTQMFGSTIANYLYNQGTAGVNKFRNLFPKSYYPYNAGELVGIKTAGRKAVGINIFNQDVEIGSIDETTGQNDNSWTTVLRSKDYMRVVPNTTYYYQCTVAANIFFYTEDLVYLGFRGITPSTFDTPENCAYIRFRLSMNYGTTYHNDVCINISDSTINGTFYPYEADEYPCEEVELNGRYILDANNNLVADGDIYNNSGVIDRTWDTVDMGSLSYTSETVYSWGTAYSANVAGIYRTNAHAAASLLVCARYAVNTTNDTNPNNNTFFNTVYKVTGTNNKIVICLEGGLTNAQIQTKLSGVMLAFKLAETTEETASSFASTQKTGVTEQFMEPETPSTLFLPVGHDSFYLPDLKEKLEDAPESPTTDGTYLVSRSGGTNVYIPIANVTATQAEIDEIIALLE